MHDATADLLVLSLLLVITTTGFKHHNHDKKNSVCRLPGAAAQKFEGRVLLDAETRNGIDPVLLTHIELLATPYPWRRNALSMTWMRSYGKDKHEGCSRWTTIPQTSANWRLDTSQSYSAAVVIVGRSRQQVCANACCRHRQSILLASTLDAARLVCSMLPASISMVEITPRSA